MTGLPDPPPTPPPSEKSVLLVVEDNESDVLFLQRAIDHTKVQLPLGIARDGSQAIDYLLGRGAFSDRSKHPLPPLMLLDLKMPKTSGLEVLQWLKKQGLTRPRVIVFTSSTESEDVRRAYDLGAVAYIVKPVSFGPLREIVKGLATFLRNPDMPIDGSLGWHIRPLL